MKRKYLVFNNSIYEPAIRKENSSEYILLSNILMSDYVKNSPVVLVDKTYIDNQINSIKIAHGSTILTFGNNDPVNRQPKPVTAAQFDKLSKVPTDTNTELGKRIVLETTTLPTTGTNKMIVKNSNGKIYIKDIPSTAASPAFKDGAQTDTQDRAVTTAEFTKLGYVPANTNLELSKKLPRLLFNEVDKQALQDGGGFVWNPLAGNFGLEEVTIEGKLYRKLLVGALKVDEHGTSTNVPLILPDQNYIRAETADTLKKYTSKKIKIYGSYNDYNTRTDPETGDINFVEGPTDDDDRLIIKAADGDKKILTEEQVAKRTEANDWVKVTKITPITVPTGATTGTGTVNNVFEDVGALDTNTQRTDFITSAKVNQRYVFTHNSIPILAIATNKTDTSVSLAGYQIIVGSKGKKIIDHIDIHVVEGNTNITEATVNAGGFKQNYPSLPENTAGNSLITKDTAEEMIREYDLKTDTRLWLTIEDTNFHTSFDENQKNNISLIHNDKIITSQHPDGHPINDNMNVMYKNGVGQTITIHYTKDPFIEDKVITDDNGQWLSDRGNVRQTIYDPNTGRIIGSFLPKVEYISNSWQVHFVDPRDTSGAQKDFEGNINITQMTLTGVELLGQEQSFTLLASDLINENTWETTGKSHHTSLTLSKGGHIIVSNLNSAKSNINLGIYASDGQQYTNITKHMNFIGPARPIYGVAFRHVADNTAGWLREILIKYELVNKTDNTKAVNNWDEADMTKLKVTFCKARKADAVGAFTSSWDIQIRGIDPKEVI